MHNIGEKMTNVNRGKLRRDIEKGEYEGRLGFQITHDNEQPGDRYGSKNDPWKPVRIRKSYGDFKEGQINLWDWGFKSKSGSAYKTKEGINYGIHSNDLWILRKRKTR